jgi:Flp pilus assembly protein TadD
MKRALELFPNQPTVLNYLGYSWVDRGLNLDKALEMIRQAVALRPYDGFFVDSLGWAHYRLKQFKDAVIFLERAVELRPEDPTITDHLGDAYWKVGRKNEARFQWERVKTLNPKKELLEKVEKKLAEGFVEEKLIGHGNGKDDSKTN